MNLDFLNFCGGSHVLKNHLLTVPAEWMLDEEFSKSCEDTKPIIKKWEDDLKFRNRSTPKDFPVLNNAEQVLPGIYGTPMFSTKFCDMVLDEIAHIKKTGGFIVNPGEQRQHQIEEFVLQNRSPGWYLCMWQLIKAKINVLFQSLFGLTVNIGTIQLANYNPNEIDQTSWHQDGLADLSMVVPLNSNYEGGGTEFWNKGVVEPLPNGNALIFPTWGELHRGLPIKYGDRYLLVFWLKTKINKDEK